MENKANENSSIRNFTRGGQTILHNFRMVNQIINRVFFFCFSFFFMTSIILTYSYTTSHQRYTLFKYSLAKILDLANISIKIDFINMHGSKREVYPRQIIHSRVVKFVLGDLFKIMQVTFLFSLFLTFILFFFLYRWLKNQGEEQTKTIQIRGEQIMDVRRLNKAIHKTSQLSDINIARLSLPNNFETRHVLIHGTTGSGKSVCIRELLEQIRLRGDRAIIYDKGCDYLKYFFNEDSDVLLNPLDKRSADWSLWDECRDSIDFDNIATALIPSHQGTSDPFWINAARTIFSSAAKQMEDNPKRSTSLLLKALINADLATLGNFLKGTESETLISEKNEKTAISIKSVLITYLKGFQALPDTEKGFSIRDWINNDRQRNWLFISSVSDRHETLKPLISMWLDIAVNALMSLEPSQSRRIWIILDELSSLQRLPYLPQACAESRKFGGCIIIGLQSIYQLRNIYGSYGAEEISNLCNTRIFFRDPSFESANWVSKELGDDESEEYRENISYSESALRSGMSISNQRFQRQIISPTEIMQLKDLDAYIRLPGNYPLTKLSFRYREYQNKNKAFVSNK